MTPEPIAFLDRRQAGLLLAERLWGLRPENPVVYALPRGGVPVGLEIARKLSAPLDLILVRKIGAPSEPELAAGAVVEGAPPLVVRNEDIIRLTQASDDHLQREKSKALEEIARRRQVYLGGRAQLSPKGKTAIVVDDGLATGATALAAIRGLRAQGAERIILAVPVAPVGALDIFEWEADQVVCPVQPRNFRGVGGVYGDFHQLDDGEVLEMLEEAKGFGRAA